MKVLNDTELKALLTKLKSKFALADHTHTGYANSTHSHSVTSTTAAGFAPQRTGTTTKFLRDDGTWAVPPDTKYNDATTTNHGLMSTADKKIMSYFQDTNNSFTINKEGSYLSLYPEDISFLNVNQGNSFIIDVANVDIAEFSSVGLGVVGKITSSGSDYAKYYEWLDGNTENEDRRGLFVTLDGEKIKTANNADDFILGIVSAAPGFVENAYEREWHGKYIKDIYGKRITREVETSKSTDENGDAIPTQTETEYVVNPEYKDEEKYIPRSERPEWTCVGLIGELVVIDDGTCKVNEYCKVAKGGIATAADETSGITKYRVMARLDDTHIKVLIK